MGISLHDKRIELLKVFQQKYAPLISLKDTQDDYKNACIVSVVDKQDVLRIGSCLYDLQHEITLKYWLGKPKSPKFPYIPGFLSLRYKGICIKAIQKFKEEFDLIIFYPGAGIQHPRFFGLASELGLQTSCSTIGITKESLVGEMTSNHFNSKPSIYTQKIYYQEKEVARFLKVKGNKKGIFVSPGHHISIETASSIIARLLVYRIPEPIRKLRQRIRFV
jgi:deoxyinosine 3'endonuclease (endonuclease V)